jgi:hypothetical protein
MDLTSKFKGISDKLDSGLVTKFESLYKYWGQYIDESSGENLLGFTMSGNPPAFLLCTSKKIIVVNEPLFKEPNVWTVSIDQLSRIETKKGMLTGEIFLHEKYTNKTFQFGAVMSRFISSFEDTVKLAMAESSKAVVIQNVTSQQQEPSDAKRIEDLAALRDKGLLTDEEFQAAKRKLLGI